MGNPLNYSLELPQRCLRLIDEGWDRVSKIYPEDNDRLGPMTSTFLLSMSMPIINIPIERIDRRRDKPETEYANDRPLNKMAALEIDKVIRKGLLRVAPFFEHGAWRLYTAEIPPPINIARGLPERIAHALNDDKSVKAAADMPTSQWCSILRNALAHGGIAYLDEKGHSSWGTPVKMYAFVSGRYDRTAQDDRRSLIGVNFLRISETDYRKFLRSWVQWLKDSGIARALEAA